MSPTVCLCHQFMAQEGGQVLMEPRHTVKSHQTVMAPTVGFRNSVYSRSIHSRGEEKSTQITML